MADNFRVGGWATDDPSKIITLTAGGDNNAIYSSFFAPGADPTVGANAYKVTAGKTFTMTLLIISFYSNGITAAISLGSADDGVGFDTVGSPTNPIDRVGDVSVSNGFGNFGANMASVNHGAKSKLEYHTIWPSIFPAEKVPFMKMETNGAGQMGVIISGFES